MDLLSEVYNMSSADDEAMTADVRVRLLITATVFTHCYCRTRLKSGAGKFNHSTEEMKGGKEKWSQCKQISLMMSLVNQMLLMNGLRGNERGRERGEKRRE